MKSFTINLSLLILGTLAALTTIEVILRVLGLGYGGVPHVSDSMLHHVHPSNYRFLFHSSTVDSDGHVVVFDEYGYRVSSIEKAERAPQSFRRLAVMGDSFVVGKEVRYEESIVGQLEKELSGTQTVRNFGVSSYSPSLYYLQWLEDVKSYNPNDVLLLLYSNDVANDMEYLRAAKYSSEHTLQAIPGPSITSINYLLRRSRVYCTLRAALLKLTWLVLHWEQFDAKRSTGETLEESPEWMGDSPKYVRMLAEEVKRAGAEFYLSAVPSKLALQRGVALANEPTFAGKIKAWADEQNIQFIDLEPKFKESASAGKMPFFNRDIHFNVVGNRIAAKEFSEKIRARNTD